MQGNEATTLRPLEILGISEPEERAYRWLLGHSSPTVQDLAQALLLSPRKAQQLLAMLETKGLATHSLERPRRYIPAAPDIAIEALTRRHQQALDQALTMIPELQKQVVPRTDAGKHVVELISGREALSQVFEQMHRVAQQEVISLIRLPMFVSRLDISVEQDHLSQRQAHARGVLYRSIVDAEFLALPGALGGIRDDMKAGEEVRVIPHLPLKMVLADHSLAFIPLNLQQPDGPSLLVRSSALLDALHSLFEILWERAAPISFTQTGMMERGESDSPLTEEAKNLISLLAAGLNDKNIAHEMGVTTRTLQRRVTALMQTLDARTRFQLGWLGALHLYASDVLSGIQESPDE